METDYDHGIMENFPQETLPGGKTSKVIVIETTGLGLHRVNT